MKIHKNMFKNNGMKCYAYFPLIKVGKGIQKSRNDKKFDPGYFNPPFC